MGQTGANRTATETMTFTGYCSHKPTLLKRSYIFSNRESTFSSRIRLFLFYFVFSFTVPENVAKPFVLGQFCQTIFYEQFRTIFYSHKDIFDRNYVVGWKISSWSVFGGVGRHNNLIL